MLFSVAMGFLEAAVVVYLRLLYYPQGFTFPMVMMGSVVLVTELLREVATLIMLAGVAYLAGHTPRQRIAFFLVAFAVWDIFYYVFLKALLDWPESLLTWDILFLVPVPWVGPVITPCLASLTMLLLAWAMCVHEQKDASGVYSTKEWWLLSLGSLVILISWTWDYFALLGPAFFSPEQSNLFFTTYIPSSFNWWMFGLGEVLLLFAVRSVYKQR